MSGTWQPLTNQPTFQACTMLLLTDGSVFCNAYQSPECWRLRPDAQGSYVNGTWTQLASMATDRLFFASAVLADGRVLVAGGEWVGGAQVETTACEIFDPVLNRWTPVTPPAGWARVGDAPCCVLTDGRLILGSIGSTATSIFDPATNTFTAGPDKLDASSEEETWTLLPDGTVLVVECDDHPASEKYVPSQNRWVSAGALPVDLVQAGSDEIGPAFLLPDGTVYCTGATGKTAIYTVPSNPADPGSWTAGPDLPTDGSGTPMQAKDVPGCLLPSGRVLLALGPGTDGFNTPTQFVEFDPRASRYATVSAPPNAGGHAYDSRLLLLPSGEVLLSTSSTDMRVYQPAGDPEEDWRPVIVSAPHHVRTKQTYQIRGRQLNGLSQASVYGDDSAQATNYPIVRIRSDVDGNEYYCRTFDHSTMGVATGSAVVSTSVKVPLGVPDGPADLVVIANGIASEPVDITVGPFRLHFPVDEGLVNRLIGSLADGPLWVLGPDGPIPVDPGWGELTSEAERAWTNLRTAAERLIALGHEAERLQAKERSPRAKPIAKASKRQVAGGRTRS